jgi:hypothetical protein
MSQQYKVTISPGEPLGPRRQPDIIYPIVECRKHPSDRSPYGAGRIISRDAAVWALRAINRRREMGAYNLLYADDAVGLGMAIEELERAAQDYTEQP